MKTFRHVLLFLLDSVGAGALPDAAKYGDTGAATIQHTIQANPGLTLPNLEKLGLFSIPGLEAFSTGIQPEGVYGKCLEMSQGKDSIVGHWEVMGVPTELAFDTFPNGFPKEIIQAFEAAIGKRTLGNIAASGTEIIAQLGAEHQRTGFPIVYTSADSVFQIAAHEETVGLKQLYEWCEIARKLLDELGYGVGRVIARPFIGTPGNYTRTANRHDYAAIPPHDTYLEILRNNGIPCHSIGKPADIFPVTDWSSKRKTSDNSEGMAAAMDALQNNAGLTFINLIDFDMKWGHRRDAEAYGHGLKAFDDFLPIIKQALPEDTLLVITADHGCDPTHTGSDHTREYIPFLIWHQGITPANCGIRDTFSDVGATILSALGCEPTAPGQSIL